MYPFSGLLSARQMCRSRRPLMAPIGALATLLAALATLLAALPAISHAATAYTYVSGPDQRVLYDAAPGESNQLRVQVSSSSRSVLLSDAGAAITPGPGCAALPLNTVQCWIETRVGLVQAALGDGADQATALTANPHGALVNLLGGPGDDVLRAQGRSRFNLRGYDGDDHLLGSHGPDRLRGDQGDDYLYGSAGDDYLTGLAGADLLRGGAGVDQLFGGLDPDKLDAREQSGTADAAVNCGAGVDLVADDAADLPSTTGCERLHERLTPGGAAGVSHR